MGTQVELGAVLMDANFNDHIARCDRCRRYDPDRPATVAELCLEGARLWKRKAAHARPKKTAAA
jgi:hypothetical protein